MSNLERAESAIPRSEEADAPKPPAGPWPGVGDLCVTSTGGWVGTGIRWVTGAANTPPFWWRRTPAPVNHVAVHVGGGVLVEGRPHGAGTGLVSWYPQARWLNLPYPEGQGELVAAAAVAMIGTRYGYLNCAAIGLVDLFGVKFSKLAMVIIRAREWATCSQLGDFAVSAGATAWEDANPGRDGLRLFHDGRPPGLVSPQDINLAYPPEPSHA